MKTINALMLAGALCVASSAMAQDYNRVAISYDNTRYSAGGDDEYIEMGVKAKQKSVSTNGFGLNYIHGFSLSSSLPMFLEVGGNINFNFFGDSEKKEKEDEDEYEYKRQIQFQFQNINLQIPVNFTWRFNVVEDFTIAPYAGINFKFNFMQRQRYYWSEYPDQDQKDLDEDKKWTNLMSDKEDGGVGSKDLTWNMFQMGWQVGVNFQYSNWVLGVQYGTDFIPAYSHKFSAEEWWEGKEYKSRVNTGNLKLSVGYCF